MRRIFSNLGFTIFIGALFLSTCFAMTALTQPANQLFIYHPISTAFTLHEPVIVDLAINNKFTEPIVIDLGKDRKANFVFSITRPDGTTAQASLPVKEGVGRIGKVTINPGQTYNQRLLLNEWLDFTTVGRYFAEMRMVGPVKTQKGKAINLSPISRIVFEITPYNIGRLNVVCEKLMQEATIAQSYEQAAEAAVALSCVVDPVAIPFLNKLLQANKQLDGVALSGLARIGNTQAIEILLSALKMENQETAIIASQQLYNIKGNISDLSLKKRVEQALSSFANSTRK